MKLAVLELKIITIDFDGSLISLHRAGNVHDSHGAVEFIKECIKNIRIYLPKCKIETRLDSAFFNDDIVELPDGDGIEFGISVPFERFTGLKAIFAYNQLRSIQMEMKKCKNNKKDEGKPLWVFKEFSAHLHLPLAS
jgi:hypothetical protein